MKRAHALAFFMAMSILSAQVQPRGTVHIYRYRLTVGTAAHPTVSCDEFAVARIQNGRVYTMNVSAGRHSFATTGNPAGIAVDVASGKEYFVRIDFQNASFGTSPIPVLVPPEQGLMETLKMRPLDRRYIEAATCGKP
jgi:hypothetical protein